MVNARRSYLLFRRLSPSVAILYYQLLLFVFLHFFETGSCYLELCVVQLDALGLAPAALLCFHFVARIPNIQRHGTCLALQIVLHLDNRIQTNVARKLFEKGTSIELRTYFCR